LPQVGVARLRRRWPEADVGAVGPATIMVAAGVCRQRAAAEVYSACGRL